MSSLRERWSDLERRHTSESDAVEQRRLDTAEELARARRDHEATTARLAAAAREEHRWPEDARANAACVALAIAVADGGVPLEEFRRQCEIRKPAAD